MLEVLLNKSLVTNINYHYSDIHNQLYH